MPICPICQREFTPSKYRPNSQKFCSDVACQRQRQLGNMKQWRVSNPHYFKMDETRSPYWKRLYKQRIQKWRKNNPQYFKEYRQKYKERHRGYMREYMRRYRRKKALLAEAEKTKEAPDIKSIQQQPTPP